MSSASSHTTTSTLASQSESLLDRLQHEAQEAADHGLQAFVSFAWLWPFRGVAFAITHPEVMLSVRDALFKSLVTSTVISTILLVFTFVPQMALLATVTGPLAPLIALLLVGIESVLLISLFARALFLEPALTHVFDATLLACGQDQLVREGKTRTEASAARSVGSTLQAFSKDGIVRYVLTFPLNFVPAVGTVLFLLYNGYNGGPGWHSRYFQLKGYSKGQRAAFVERRRAEYTAFGMGTLPFTFIPLFSFTNTVGAALWAAQLEAETNIIDTQVAPSDKKAD